jgi:hypothetical protein
VGEHQTRTFQSLFLCYGVSFLSGLTSRLLFLSNLIRVLFSYVKVGYGDADGKFLEKSVVKTEVRNFSPASPATIYTEFYSFP